ncbi:uncharacterized protein [Engystomops pustulosus]|uniref:uncharacterized protein isoform X2 n=1 Tax=Engystomops pustulosus TaxID=76066 RepID=UPI003AFAD5D9
MKFLWAFLLLAFTIDSVYSNGCRSPADYRQAFGQAFQTACAVLNGVNFPKLAIDGIMPGSGSATSLTNVVLSDAHLLDINVNITENCLAVKIEIKVDLDSDQFNGVLPSLKAQVKTNLNLDMDTVYGYSKYVFNKDSLKTSLTMDEILLILSLDVLEGDFTPLEILMGGVMQTATALFNDASRATSNTPFTLGNTLCRYRVSEVQHINGIPHGRCCLICDGGEICPSGPITPITPEPHEGYVMVFSPELVTRAAELSLIDLSVQIGLDAAQLDGAVSPGSYPNANFNFRIRVSAINNLVLEEGAGSLDLSVAIELHASDTVIARGSSDVNMGLRAGFQGGFMSLDFSSSVIADVNVDTEVTIRGDDGNSGPSAGTFLKKMLNSHVNVLVDKMNCKMERCFPVLPVFGPRYPAMPLPPAYPPTQGSYHSPSSVLSPGQCHFGHNYCRCFVPPLPIFYY